MGVVLFLFPIMLVVLGLLPNHKFYTLPYFGVDTIYSPEVEEDFDSRDFYKVPNFELTNQDGDIYNNDSLKGEIWVAAFFATNSYAIREISDQLLSINYKYKDEPGINLVCFTQDVENDTPEVLKEYVEKMTPYNKDKSKWQFLTGNQEKIDHLTSEGFMIKDFKNTTVIWLVDGDGHLRGRYHSDDGSEVKKTREDIALLRKEMDRKAHDQEQN